MRIVGKNLNTNYDIVTEEGRKLEDPKAMVI